MTVLAVPSGEGSDPSLHSVVDTWLETWASDDMYWQPFDLHDDGSHKAHTCPRRQLNREDVLSAIEGDISIVARPAGEVETKWIALDIDSIDDDQVRLIPGAIAERGLAPADRVLLLRSGRRGGLHVFLLFDTPIPNPVAVKGSTLLRLTLEALGIEVDQTLPERRGQGIRLPGMPHLRFGQLAEEDLQARGVTRQSQIIDHQTLLPLPDQLEVLADPPRVDGARFEEVVLSLPDPETGPENPASETQREARELEARSSEAGRARRWFRGLFPCVQHFIVDPITERGKRNKRAFAIAAVLRLRSASHNEIFTVLMDWYDRVYQVGQAGTSRADHESEAEDLARRAANNALRFDCFRNWAWFEEYHENHCALWRKTRAGTEPAMLQPWNPELSALGPYAMVIYARHLARAWIAGYDQPYFIRAREESLGLCDPRTALKARRALIEAGFVRETPYLDVPRQIIEANGHHSRLLGRRPAYYRLGPKAYDGSTTAADPGSSQADRLRGTTTFGGTRSADEIPEAGPGGAE